MEHCVVCGTALPYPSEAYYSMHIVPELGFVCHYCYHSPTFTTPKQQRRKEHGICTSDQ